MLVFLQNFYAMQCLSCKQAQLADRESKLAELEATSTGEVARLRAALEVAKGDVIRIKQEQVSTNNLL